MIKESILLKDYLKFAQTDTQLQLELVGIQTISKKRKKRLIKSCLMIRVKANRKVKKLYQKLIERIISYILLKEQYQENIKEAEKGAENEVAPTEKESND